MVVTILGMESLRGRFFSFFLSLKTQAYFRILAS
jgi:hypothetical protein